VPLAGFCCNFMYSVVWLSGCTVAIGLVHDCDEGSCAGLFPSNFFFINIGDDGGDDSSDSD